MFCYTNIEFIFLFCCYMIFGFFFSFGFVYVFVIPRTAVIAFWYMTSCVHREELFCLSYLVVNLPGNRMWISFIVMCHGEESKAVMLCLPAYILIVSVVTYPHQYLLPSKFLIFANIFVGNGILLWFSICFSQKLRKLSIFSYISRSLVLPFL